MKKALIAGVASLAIAAMPVAGVFAADFTDQINLSIANNCAFTRGTTAHGTGTWTTDTTDTKLDKLTSTAITAGSESTLGTSTYHVVCNNSAGYQVTMEVTDLTATGGTIAYGAAATAGNWSITSDGTGAATTAATKLATKAANTTTTADGVDFTVTYKAYPAANQAAGSYQGTAAYTFAQL